MSPGQVVQAAGALQQGQTALHQGRAGGLQRRGQALLAILQAVMPGDHAGALDGELLFEPHPGQVQKGPLQHSTRPI